MNRPTPTRDEQKTEGEANEAGLPTALVAAACAVVHAIDADERQGGRLISRKTLMLNGVLRRAIRQMRWRS